MNAYLSRLNPAERRFVIGVGLMVFLVVNVFWIWPRFSDWTRLKGRIERARRTEAVYQALIRQKPEIETKLKKLQSQGTYVPLEDQLTQFLRTIQTQAAQSHVNFTGSSRPNTSTNEFFIEQAQTISVVSGEKELVDFLYSLGSGNSLIRVRALSVRPSPNRQELNSSITLVASYQKQRRPAAPPASSVTKPAAPTAKPGTAAPSRLPPASGRPGAVPVKPISPGKSTPVKK